MFYRQYGRPELKYDMYKISTAVSLPPKALRVKWPHAEHTLFPDRRIIPLKYLSLCVSPICWR